jgi:hypothetical protein
MNDMLTQVSAEVRKVGNVDVETFVCDDGSRAIIVADAEGIINATHSLPIVLVLTKRGFVTSCYNLDDVEALLKKNDEVVSRAQSSKIDDDEEDLYGYTAFGCPF